MQARNRSRALRSAALAVLGGMLIGATAHANGFAAGRPVGTAPAHAPQHRMAAHPVTGHPGSPALAATFIRPVVPPVIFTPIVPGFVTWVPPVVIVTPVVAPPVFAPVPVHLPQPVPLPGVVAAQPQVPVIAPSSPLFFAPPVHTVPPVLGGQVLIIRRTGH